MNHPTLKQCHGLFSYYQVPSPIRLHCQKVSQVATFLAQELNKNNYPLNTKIVQRLSLLHDLLKVVVLENVDYPPMNFIANDLEIAMHKKLKQQFPNTNEVRAAYLIFKDEYPEFAQLFLELEEVTKNPTADISAETHLVHYTDYRIMNNEILLLDERMSQLYHRYEHFIKKKNLDWGEIKKILKEYEQNIFKHLDFKPEELRQKINPKNNNFK